MLSGALTIVFLVAICIVGYQLIYKKIYIDSFVVGSSIQFMAADETARFLKEDADAYIRSMSPWDLYARKAATPEKYKSKAMEATASFSSDQKVRYAKATKEADAFLAKLHIADIDTTAIAAIPWIIAMTTGTTYEDGLPHTRENVIFVSTETDEAHNDLVRTLIHEKVHLYQRMHPEAMMVYFEQRGCKRWKPRFGEPRIRANPDVDPYIYIDPATQEAMAAYYSTDKPSSITDVVMDDPAFEHPYEKVAYEIASRYEEKTVSTM